MALQIKEAQLQTLTLELGITRVTDAGIENGELMNFSCPVARWKPHSRVQGYNNFNPTYVNSGVDGLLHLGGLVHALLGRS